MSDIPSFPYRLLWEERQILSIASLTRQDGIDFLRLAPKIGIITVTTPIRSTRPTRPSPISVLAGSKAPPCACPERDQPELGGPALRRFHSHACSAQRPDARG
jgi:hypothetical protein